MMRRRGLLVSRRLPRERMDERRMGHRLGVLDARAKVRIGNARLRLAPRGPHLREPRGLHRHARFPRRRTGACTPAAENPGCDAPRRTGRIPRCATQPEAQGEAPRPSASTYSREEPPRMARTGRDTSSAHPPQGEAADQEGSQQQVHRNTKAPEGGRRSARSSAAQRGLFEHGVCRPPSGAPASEASGVVVSHSTSSSAAKSAFTTRSASRRCAPASSTR